MKLQAVNILAQELLSEMEDLMQNKNVNDIYLFKKLFNWIYASNDTFKMLKTDQTQKICNETIFTDFFSSDQFSTCTYLASLCAHEQFKIPE